MRDTCSNAAYAFRCAVKYSKPMLAFGAVYIACVIALDVLALYLPKNIVSLIEQRATTRDFALIVAAFAVSIVTLRGIWNYADCRFSLAVFEPMVGMQHELNEKAMSTDYANLAKPEFIAAHNDALASFQGGGSGAVRAYYTLRDLFVAIGGFIVFLSVLAGVDALLLLVIAASTAVDFGARAIANNYEKRKNNELAAIDGKLWYVNSASVSAKSMKDIRIFSAAKWLRDVSDRFAKLDINLRAKIARRQFAADVVVCLTALLRDGLAYLYLFRAVISQNMPASQFVLLFAAVSGFSGCIAGIMNCAGALYGQLLSFGKARKLLEWKEEFRSEGGLEMPVSQTHSLELEDVSYRYPGAEGDILSQINLKINAGEKIALVGLNGAGKTTLVKLLCGFVDPSAGRVLMDGIDIRDFNRDEYYRALCCVFQQHSILPLTVAQNVAQSTRNIDAARVRECLKLAGILEKIESLPQGADTNLIREVNLDAPELSGGETQRLMLARALYRRGEILALDEPTAALDPIAESEMYNRYNEMTAGRTAIFVSHRLASTRFCDRVLYIENGEIAEQGAHDTLMARGGKYAELFNVQAQYYQANPKGGAIDGE